jgi:hypothetical protein
MAPTGTAVQHHRAAPPRAAVIRDHRVQLTRLYIGCLARAWAVGSSARQSINSHEKAQKAQKMKAQKSMERVGFRLSFFVLFVPFRG